MINPHRISLCVRNSISCAEQLNFGAFNYCSSYSEPNRNHKISLCLQVFLMKLCTQTLFSPGYTELVRLTLHHSGVATLLLKDCIMQQDLLLSAEFTISKWLLWLFCWWQIFEELIPIFKKHHYFPLQSSTHRCLLTFLFLLFHSPSVTHPYLDSINTYRNVFFSPKALILKKKLNLFILIGG